MNTRTPFGKRPGDSLTVDGLIEQLRRFPGHWPVVADLHSEYATVKSLTQMSLFDNGGYVSRPYSPEHEARTRDCVYLGVE